MIYKSWGDNSDKICSVRQLLNQIITIVLFLGRVEIYVQFDWWSFSFFTVWWNRVASWQLIITNRIWIFAIDSAFSNFDSVKEGWKFYWKTKVDQTSQWDDGAFRDSCTVIHITSLKLWFSFYELFLSLPRHMNAVMCFQT